MGRDPNLEAAGDDDEQCGLPGNTPERTDGAFRLGNSDILPGIDFESVDDAAGSGIEAGKQIHAPRRRRVRSLTLCSCDRVYILVATY